MKAWNPMTLLPLVGQLGQHLKAAVDHYALLKAAGGDVAPEMLTPFIREKLASWDPKLGDKSLLDDPTRDAAARFLAGLAINFAGA